VISTTRETRSQSTVISTTHVFFEVAIETASWNIWNQMAVELVQEIVKRITMVTEDTRETAFLFQRLSIALQRAGAVLAQKF